MPIGTRGASMSAGASGGLMYVLASAFVSRKTVVIDIYIPTTIEAVSMTGFKRADYIDVQFEVWNVRLNAQSDSCSLGIRLGFVWVFECYQQDSGTEMYKTRGI